VTVVNTETRNEVVRRWYVGQSMRGIASDLQLSRNTVRRLLDAHEEERQRGASPGELSPLRRRRDSVIDTHLEKIRELLKRYPKITVKRLLEELRKHGYQGGYSILCERVKQLRTSPPTPWVERFETAAGVQSQMDYAVYTIDFTSEGRRRVNLFSWILSYSRRQYLRFVESQDMETTLREHIRAFQHLGGVAATGLYDNMKVVVSRYEDDQPIYNPRFLAFSTHYGFRPVACRPRRPQTKGKVERPFHYVETNLLCGREFRSLEHLNEVTAWWLAEVADCRVHRTTQRRPIDLHAEEQPHLIALPEQPYAVAEVVYRTVDAEGYIAYGQNRYSVPWQATRPGQLLPVKITEDEVVIYGTHLEEIARHVRFSRTATRQESRHKAHRPPRDTHRRRKLLKERFDQLGEVATGFLEGLLKTHRNGWHQAEKVLGLLATYRREDVTAALQRAVRYGAFSLNALERILAVQARPKTTLQHLTEQGAKQLDDTLREPAAPPRPASDYQQLLFPETNCHDQQTDNASDQQPQTNESQPQDKNNQHASDVPDEPNAGNDEPNASNDESP